jgi:hypothetical protein
LYCLSCNNPLDKIVAILLLLVLELVALRGRIGYNYIQITEGSGCNKGDGGSVSITCQETLKMFVEMESKPEMNNAIMVLQIQTLPALLLMVEL